MSNDVSKYVRYLAAERDAGRMYRALAQLTEGDPQQALRELASIEDRHAAHWEQMIRESGHDVPADTADLDVTSEQLVERARRMSLRSVLPELEAAERDAQGMYDHEPAAPPGMAEDERLHAQVLQSLDTEPGVFASLGPGVTPTLVPATASARTPGAVRASLNQAEPWHRTDKSGSLRAAVFGVSDGLVSNTALVMGFAGSGIGSSTILFAGLAGLLAGAFSMAAGEFVSVSSQRDLFRREIALEAQELRDKPQEETRELELLYRAKGLDRDTARAVAKRIMSDPKTALDTLAREELGLDPDELGSPLKVAASSFAAFAVGAAVPVIPYFLADGIVALIAAVVLAVIALVVVGATVGYLSGAGAAKSALRQLLVGGGAAGVTFVLGKAVGVGLG